MRAIFAKVVVMHHPPILVRSLLQMAQHEKAIPECDWLPDGNGRCRFYGPKIFEYFCGLFVLLC